MSTAASQLPEARGSGYRAGLWALLLFAIFYIAQPLNIAFTLYDEADADENVQSQEEGHWGRRVGLSTLAVIGLAALANAKGRPMRIRGSLGVAILTFLAWSAASTVWSGAPLLTLRKLATLACLVIGAGGVARLLSRQQIAALTILLGSGALLLGLGSEIVLRTFMPWESEYRFAGIAYPAFTAWTLSLLLMAGLALRGQPYRWAILAVMLLALPMLLLTKTRTGAAALLAGAATYTLVVWPPRRTLRVGVAVGLVVCLVLMAAAAFQFQAIGTVGNILNLGREKESIGTLSGRTEVWHELRGFIVARPWLGYGYESFWTPDRLQEFGDINGWAVPDAHNGYINLTLGVGLIGTLFMTLVLILGVARAARGYLRSRDECYAFMAGGFVVYGVNMLGVATQLGPYLASFLTMVLLARLAFVENLDESALVP